MKKCMIFNEIEIPCIGQGCFVVQTLKTLNNREIRIIYDCGSLDKDKLENEIDELKPNIETILIISHFHSDHINGIERLREKKFNIKKLVIPQIENYLLPLFAIKLNSKELVKFVFNPESFFSDCKIIRVRHSNNQPNLNDIPLLSDIPNDETIPDNLPYQILSDNFCSWVLKFFVDEQIFLRLSKKQKKLLNSIKIDNFGLYKNELINIYTSISDSRFKLNHTSMLMASFPICKYEELCLYNPFLRTILCTGDYPIMTIFDSKKISNHYKTEQNKLFEMMAPHHASDKYFNELPFSEIKLIYAQNGKRYKKHPGKETVANINKWGIPFININPFRRIT